MKCNYCGSDTKKIGTEKIYGGESFGLVLICVNYPACDSYVGCHRNGEPKGSLANGELRRWRRLAHSAFDAKWANGSRSQCYAWLAKAMDIPPDKCHIGMFDIAQCQKVIELCPSKYPVREAFAL